MSWMSELVDLYDRNQNKAGKVTNLKLESSETD